MQNIANKLNKAMVDEKLFLSNELFLKGLSDHIKETENHISETLSQQLHNNFFNYANGFRIEEAKKALAESSQLIINLAYDVGFNSKSIFNSAFKKAEGCSPSGYRKQLIDNIESQKVA
jgi:AraC-like DNA-binding protein